MNGVHLVEIINILDLSNITIQKLIQLQNLQRHQSFFGCNFQSSQQDVAKYKAERNKKPKRKKKPKFKRRKGATFDATEYQKEVDEIHSGIGAFENDQAIRSSAWGVGASATDATVSNKPQSTEPEIQQRGNIRSFKHSRSSGNIQNKGNVHSIKHQRKRRR